MDAAGSETVKDEKALPRSPPVSASAGQIKANASSTKNVIPKSQSKIPKRNVFSVSKYSKQPSLENTKPVVRTTISKPAEGKKFSKSQVDLNISKPMSRGTCPSTSRITPRSHRSETCTGKAAKAGDRAKTKKNILAFENVKEKMRTYQTEFLKHFEQVKNDLPPDEGEYKLIGLVKNNEGFLVTKTLQKIGVKSSVLPAHKNVDSLKNELEGYHQHVIKLFYESIDELNSTQTKVGDTSTRGLESTMVVDDIKKNIKALCMPSFDKLLKQVEDLQVNTKMEGGVPVVPNASVGIQTVSDSSELELKVNSLIKQIEEQAQSIEEGQNELTSLKRNNEITEAIHQKELEDRDKKIAKKQHDYDELKKTCDHLEKTGSKEKHAIKDLHDKLGIKTSEIEELKKRLKCSLQSNSDHLTRNQEHEARIRKLEFDLNAALKEIEKRTRMEHSFSDQAMRHTEEIKTLKTEILSIKREKEKLEKEFQMFKKEAEKLSESAAQLVVYKEKVKILDNDNHELRTLNKQLDTKLKASENQATVTKETIEELIALRESDAAKTNKLQYLEMELNKANFHNQKLQEKVVMDRKLLKVRGCLIESLQMKESTQKVHLEDLFAEVGERNNDIQLLKSELVTKTEEFQNLFGTLNTKQLELTRQEHMIKLLQESNERAQTLRVKQEAKIGRLEEEILQLKKSISLYQETVLPNRALRNRLLAEASRDSDTNDKVLCIYSDERRRKRHIDIEVKKYEK